MDGLHEDDGGMLCSEHPFKNNTPAGGICAFCLQDKLGKLVSSSFPIAVFPSSSSSSPSFRSEINPGNGGTSSTTITTTITTTTTVSNAVLPPGLASNQVNPSGNSNECHYHHYYENNNSHSRNNNKSRILYLLSQKKKKNKDVVDNKNVVFKRSKSTVTPRRNGGTGLHYADSDNGDGLTSPHKRGFWSFLYLQKHSHTHSSKKSLRDISSNTLCASFPSQIQRSGNTIVVEENDGSPCHATFDRKVSRSRSVGCGSRSFSGDFFERISTGFGDCTLRRVESHREGKSKVSSLRAATSGGQDNIKERVRCGGLFSGFMITSSSSSSSSSSYWVASNPNEGNHNHNHDTGKMTSATPSTSVRLSHQHSRSRSWGWALASPMRAFSKPSSNKKEAQNKNPTPNLSAIPSLLSVRS